MRSRMMRLAFSSLLLATAVEATTYRVPRDADMIAAAKAIVSGTVIDQSVSRSDNGLIVTTTRLVIEERIKNAPEERVLSFVLPGGEVGDEGLIVPGVPSFSPGDRVLLFLDRNRRGEWAPFGWALGVFRFRETLLTRDADEMERARDAKDFVNYVRSIVRGNNPPADSFVSELQCRSKARQHLRAAAMRCNPTRQRSFRCAAKAVFTLCGSSPDSSAISISPRPSMPASLRGITTRAAPLRRRETRTRSTPNGASFPMILTMRSWARAARFWRKHSCIRSSEEIMRQDCGQ
jgi:hypothetical protein